MNSDIYLFNSINSLAGKKKWLDFLAIFFATYLAYILAFVLVSAAFILRDIKILIFPVLAGVFSRFVINEIIYFFCKRKRPSEVINAKILIKVPNHPSFPSGHASFFFALSFLLAVFNISLGIVFITLTCLIVFFRIFSGVHWPSDILAGIISAGISYPLFIWILYTL